MSFTRRNVEDDATWARAWTADAYVDLASISSIKGSERPHHGDVAFVVADNKYYLWMDDDSWKALGAGDVVGPTSAINSNLVVFDGTTGKLVKDSLIPSIQVARRDTVNTFTKTQTILTSDNPHLELSNSGPIRIIFKDTSQPVDKRIFRIFSGSQFFFIDAVNDAVTVAESTPLTLDRVGNAAIANNLTVGNNLRTVSIFEQGRAYFSGQLNIVVASTYVSTPYLTTTSSLMGYTRSGPNLIYIQLLIVGTVNAGAPNTAFYVLTLPEGAVAQQSLYLPITVYDTTGWATGMISFAAGSPQGFIYGSAIRPWVATQPVYLSASFWVGVS